MVRALILLLLGLGPAAAWAASFDCQKAASATEKTICASERLSDLDEAIAFAFGLRNPESSDETLQTQRQWLKQRDACAAGLDCLSKSLEQRLRQLLEVGLPDSTEGVGYLCDGRTESMRFGFGVKARGLPLHKGPSVSVPSDGVIALRHQADVAYAECRFESGAEIRAKVRTFHRSPYGACGADPGEQFTAWINRRKRADFEILRAGCGFKILLKAELSERRMKRCLLSIEEGLECDLPRIKVDAVGMDVREFGTRPGGRRTSKLLWRTEYAANLALCKAMVSKSANFSEPLHWVVSPPEGTGLRSGPVERTGGASPQLLVSHFDLLNEGAKSLIVSVDFDGFTTLLLLKRNDPASFELPMALDSGLGSLKPETRLVLPQAWARCSGGFEWDSAEPACAIRLKHYHVDGKSFAYDVKQLSLEPFEWHGVTHLLGSTPYWWREAVHTVWKMRPDGGADEVCIFSRADR